jgi:DNA-binding MarR family transcriptional regulator
MHLVALCSDLCSERSGPIADLERLMQETGRFKRMLHRVGQRSAAASRERSANWLLLAVKSRGPLRLADLAAACYIDASTASRQTTDLITRGLLRRQADPDDGRASLLALTDDGERALAELIRAREEFFAAALADWDPDDIQRLAELLTRFTDAIGAQADRQLSDHDESTDVRKAAR